MTYRHYDHERVLDLSFNLTSRFARRGVDKLAAYESVVRRLGPRAPAIGQNTETVGPSSGRFLGGLEVVPTTGSQVSITAGAVVCATPSPVTEPRPVTWSGQVEPDDSPYGLAELRTGATVSPTTPITSALAQAEWWVVYVVATEVPIETEGSLEIYNDTMGAFDNTGSAVKVTQRQLVPGVLRGTPGGAVPTSLPAGALPIAWLRVPSGATDLSGAVTFDVRKMPDQDPGPNMIGGSWCLSMEGTQDTDHDDNIMNGEVWARLGGERLSASNNGNIQVGDIAEPGATWNVAADAAHPKFAWLYLCKTNGVVPRPVAHGNKPVGNNPSFINDVTIIHGALVLSPTPPRIGTGDSNNQTGHRWDMRASAPLSPASFAKGDGVPHAFAGTTVAANDAICVGFFRYVGIQDGLPILFGTMAVDEQGWVRGNAISSRTSGGGLATDGLLFSNPAPSTNNGVTPRTWQYTARLAELAVGSDTFVPPIDGVRFTPRGTLSGPGIIEWQTYDNGIMTGADPATPFNWRETLERRSPAPGNGFFTPAFRGLLDSSETFATNSMYLIAVRLPYGLALVT